MFPLEPPYYAAERDWKASHLLRVYGTRYEKLHLHL